MAPHSGRFILRLPPELHRALRERAHQDSLSLNQTCISLLSAGLGNQGADETLLTKLRSVFGTALIGIILFGSRARGTAMDTSDTDFLLVFDAETEISRNLYRKWDSSTKAKVHPSLSLHCVTVPDLKRAGSLWLEVALDGIVLWEQGRAATSVLGHLKREIAEGRYVREISHGHGYWRRIA